MMEALYRLLGLQTLRRRILFWVVVLITLIGTLFAASFFAIDTFSKKREARVQIQHILTQQRMFIDRWKEERAADIRYLAYRNSGPMPKEEKTKRDFHAFLSSRTDFSGLVFVDGEGRIVFDSLGVPTGADLSGESYFVQAMKGKDAVTEISDGRVGGKPVVLFSSPVADEGGHFSGLVFGTVKLETLEGIVDRFTMGETGRAYLLDADGRLLTRPPSSGDDLPIAGSIQAKLFRMALYEEHPESLFLDSEGQERFADYQWTQDRRWIIAAEVAKDEVFAPLYRVMLYTLGVFVGLLALCYIGIRFLVKRIERVFRLLLDSTRVMEQGNYGHLIPEDAVCAAPIEMRRLSHSFNLASAKLAATIHMLEQSAFIDQTTQVYNRRHLMTEGQRVLDSCLRSGRPCALLMVDADRFKRVNDTFGHLIGDRVLIHLVSVMQECLNPTDILARFGGEEFVILCPDASPDEAAGLAERIRRTVEGHPCREDETAIPLTISIGVAGANRDRMYGKTPIEDMTARADLALYEAKRTGRNKVVLDGVPDGG